MSTDRTELEQEIVRSLIDSKAIDFEAAGAILAKYGAQAALAGSELIFRIDRRVALACGIAPRLEQLKETLEQ